MSTSRKVDVVLASRYWLTPEGCAAISEHRPDLDGRHCRTCGTRLEGRAA